MATSSSSRRKASGAALAIGLAAALAVASGHQSAEVWTEPVTGMRFVRVPAGSFIMGTPRGVEGREAEEVPHRVTISRDFHLGQFEVTQEQWARVMGRNPSHFTACGGDCPVERVSYLDIQAFIGRLAARTGERLRLPTEAEWEYACRAGTTTAYATGDHLTTDQANFNGRFPGPGAPQGLYRETTTPVGSFPPNAWGLHDMHGNVWEWTEDRHCAYPDGPVTDPLGRCAGEKHVIRGGSWYFDANSARCALRYDHRPQDLGFSLGFRLARSPAPEDHPRHERSERGRPIGPDLAPAVQALGPDLREPGRHHLDPCGVSIRGGASREHRAVNVEAGRNRPTGGRFSNPGAPGGVQGGDYRGETARDASFGNREPKNR